MINEIRDYGIRVDYKEIMDAFQKIESMNENIIDFEELTYLLIKRMGWSELVRSLPTDSRGKLERVISDIEAEEHYRIELDKFIMTEIETHHYDKPNVKGDWKWDVENNKLIVTISSSNGLLETPIEFEFYNEDFKDYKRTVKEVNNYYMTSNGFLEWQK